MTIYFPLQNTFSVSYLWKNAKFTREPVLYCFNKMWNCYRYFPCINLFHLIKVLRPHYFFPFILFPISRNFAPNIGYAYHLWVPATPIGGWRGAEKKYKWMNKICHSTCLPPRVRKECFIISLRIFVNVINVLPPTEIRGWYLDAGNVFFSCKKE